MRVNFIEKLSLKTILIAGAILVALIPAAALGIGSAVSIRNLVFTLLTNRDRFLAQTLAAQVDEFLTSRKRDLVTLGEIAALQQHFDAPSLMPIIAAMRRNDSTYLRMFITDARGVSIAADPPVGADGKSSIGVDYSDRDYFRDMAKNHQALVYKDLVIGKVAKEKIAVIAAPVLDSAGQFKGITAVAVDISGIEALANGLRFGRTGYAAIATPSGQQIAHGANNGEGESIDLSKTQIWNRITASASGEIQSYVGTQGDERLGGFATVPEVGWKIWVSRSVSEIEGQIFSAYQLILWWVLAALAGMIVLAVWYARTIAKPIDTLRSAASEIADGRLDQEVPPRGPREMIDLARALNHMAQSLRKLLASERDAKTRIEKAVSEYGALAARVANGDLTARAPADSAGEFAQLGANLNQMTGSLSRLVREIQSAASDMSSSASEILAATSQQVSATSEEATAVKETAATVAQVKQTADLAAQKAKAVADVAQKATRVAEDGQHSVDESVKGSQDSKTRMEALAERILALSEQAHAIAEINATVNDLAEQSNLLAVNASIEAAKAGDAGRGFAVVAGEVKALAEQCKQATTQVRGILNEIQRATQAAVMAAEQGVKSSEAGVAVASRSGEAIRQLSQNVSEAAHAAQQIVAASQQQAIGMDQIALAMHNIQASSEQTVSATRQFEGAAKNLNELGRRLTSLVQGLSVGEKEGA